MRFNNEQDITKNLHQSVFYSQKLKKAIMLVSVGRGLKVEVYAASEEGFNKKIHTLDASKEFHLTCVTGGFAPRTFGGSVISAERKPVRKWHHGWSYDNAKIIQVRVSADGEDLLGRSIGFNRDWYCDNGFIGHIWTGGFRSFKGVLEDGVGALSPTLAVIGNNLVNLTSIIGKIKNEEVLLDPEYYSSFLVRELKDLGVKEVKEMQNGC